VATEMSEMANKKLLPLTYGPSGSDLEVHPLRHRKPGLGGLARFLPSCTEDAGPCGLRSMHLGHALVEVAGDAILAPVLYNC
jgi:hypothetical protein